jgi:Zn-dependent protease/CBS domain-containing protein
MMPFLGRSITVLKVFGVPIKINPTWLLLFVLIVFSLSSEHGMLREWVGEDELGGWGVWLLGVLCALALFASLLVHELCHSLVARYTGMPVRGITLFIFGGVSELGDEPTSAVSEFFMAIVGPLSSMIIGVACLVALAVSSMSEAWPGAVRAVLMFLGTVNIWLAVFNSIPAFPLDGGRLVRSLLWAVTGNLRRSTQIAAWLGSFFGALMIAGGICAFFGIPPFRWFFSPIGGIWLIFIGLFLRQAAAGSLQHVVMRQALGGEPVGRFMTSNPLVVPPDLPLRRFVDECVLPHHFALYPVVDASGMLIGVVHALDPRRVEPAFWDTVTVREVMHEPSPDTTVPPDLDAVDALARLRTEQGKRLVVVQDGRPVGIVSLRDLLDFLALKLDLEGE